MSGDGQILRMKFDAVNQGPATTTIELIDARAWTHEEILEMTVAAESGDVKIVDASSWLTIALVAVAAAAIIGLFIATRRRKPAAA